MLTLFFLIPSLAAFDIADVTWDGMSDVAAMARRLGVRIVPGSATFEDAATLILYPSTRVDAVALAGNRPNSRVAVFDDFGGELDFARDAVRRDSDVRAEMYWQGIRDLPVARSRRAHPTTTGVRDVVMNRPAPDASRRTWQSASAILEFSAGNPAAVASANLVLGADPSLFINRMLAFGDNRRFVENLLRWLSLDGRVAVKLVVGPAAHGISLLHRPGAETEWMRPVSEFFADLNLNLGRRPEPVASADWLFAVLAFGVAVAVARPWFRARGRMREREREKAEMEDAWFDLNVRLENARAAMAAPSNWPRMRALGRRIGANATRVARAHAVLDAIEVLPRVERLLPPPLGDVSRREGGR